jgi:hypothetical protein
MLDQNLVAEILQVARAGGAEFSKLFIEDRITRKTLKLMRMGWGLPHLLTVNAN